MLNLTGIRQNAASVSKRFLDEDAVYRAISSVAPTGAINFSSAGDMQILKDVFTAESAELIKPFDIFNTSKYPGLGSITFDVENNFIKFIKKWFDVSLLTEEIVVFNGIFGSYSTILSANPRKMIVCPEVMYARQRVCFTLAGKELLEVHVDSEGLMDLDHLESLFLDKSSEIGYVYVNHNLGVGVDMPYIKRLAELLLKFDVYAIYDMDVLITAHKLGSDPFLPVRSKELRGRSILLVNLSKEIGSPGTRIGFGIGPKDLIKELRFFQELKFEIIPTPNKYFAALLFDHVNLQKTKDIFCRRMKLVSSGFQKLGWNVKTPDIGINIFIPVPKAFLNTRSFTPGAVFSYYCAKYLGIKVRPGSVHGHKMADHIRMVISPTEDEIVEAFERLKSAGVSYDMDMPEDIELEFSIKLSLNAGA